jgi:hypothetical protein
MGVFSPEVALKYFLVVRLVAKRKAVGCTIHF